MKYIKYMNQLAKLSIRLSGNNIPENVKDVYCFAHNEINIPCMIKGIQQNSRLNEIYLLNNINSMSGVLAYSDVSNIYKSYGMKTYSIPYNESNISINTRIESEAIVDWCINTNKDNLIICAPPYHLLRAYMTLVTVCIEKNYNLKIYVINGIVNNWHENTITHSGNTNASFNDVIDLELKRIIKYTQKGDILPDDYIWNYLIK